MTETVGLETQRADVDPSESFGSIPEESPPENPSERSTAQELSEPVPEETTEEPTEALEKEPEKELEKEPETKVAKEPEKKQDAVQKRINKLTRKNYDTIREKEVIEQKLELATAELSKLREAKETKETEALEADINAPRPDRENYASEEDFFIELGQWSSKQENAKFAKQQKEQQSQPEKQPQSEMDKMQIKLAPIQDKIVNAGRVSYPDFDEVALAQDKGVVITPEMIFAMEDDPNAADVFYELSKDPAESQRISQLSPAAAARELFKISMKFDPVEESVSSETITKTTKASEPIKPIGTKTINTKDPTKMTNAEYRKHRAGQGVVLY